MVSKSPIVRQVAWFAFCYGQSGDGKRSKEFYEKTLREFPNSEIAKASLRMFESAKDFAVPVNSVDPKGRAVD